MNRQTLSILIISTLLIAACGDDATSKDTPNTTNKTISTNDGGAVILETGIPPEHIEGTPQPIQVPNLERPPTSVPILMVPKGTHLLSLGKPVTASDDFTNIGEIDYITDGDKEAGEGYFVEIIDGLQWVQIDLGAPAKINAIWLWHYHLEARAYHDVVVQLSNDPTFKSGVFTLFNNDYDNSSLLGKGSDRPYVETRFGKLIQVDGHKAQFVRLYSNGNTSNDNNHYVEVEVFGIEEI